MEFKKDVGWKKKKQPCRNSLFMDAYQKLKWKGIDREDTYQIDIYYLWGALGVQNGFQLSKLFFSLKEKNSQAKWQKFNIC